MTMILYIDGGGPVTAEYTDLAPVSPEASSHSIDVATGSPGSNKHVVCIVHYYGPPDANRRLGSATIDGVTAPILRQDVWDPDSSVFSDHGVAIIGAPVTSPSSTLSVALNANAGSITIARMGVYRVMNLLSLTPVAVNGGATALSGDVAGLTRNVAAVSGGIVVAGVNGFNTNPAAFVSGVSGDYTVSSAAAGGHALITADEASRAVRYERSSLSIYFAMSVVSLR